MFAVAFESIFDFVMGVLIIYGSYRLVFYKSLNKEAELKSAKMAAIKLAIVKMHSNDHQDIESFLNKNAQYLEVSMVEKLADKLETLKILNDEPLKKRFEDLENHQRVSPVPEVHDNQEDSTEFSGINNRKIGKYDTRNLCEIQT
jgi:hypothetical protein